VNTLAIRKLRTRLVWLAELSCLTLSLGLALRAMDGPAHGYNYNYFNEPLLIEPLIATSG
jgi:hypothetical protein